MQDFYVLAFFTLERHLADAPSPALHRPPESPPPSPEKSHLLIHARAYI